MARKAPGKSYRKGMTLQEHFRVFPDDATVEQWFAEKRWPAKTRFHPFPQIFSRLSKRDQAVLHRRG